MVDFAAIQASAEQVMSKLRVYQPCYFIGRAGEILVSFRPGLFVESGAARKTDRDAQYCYT
jgi:hypothetical protein